MAVNTDPSLSRTGASILIITLLLTFHPWSSSCGAADDMYNQQPKQFSQDDPQTAPQSTTTATSGLVSGFGASLNHERNHIQSLKGLSRADYSKRGATKSLARMQHFLSITQKAVKSSSPSPTGRKALQLGSYDSTVAYTAGDYSIYFLIGTGFSSFAYNFIATADTGSDLTWVQGGLNFIKGYQGPDRRFNSQASDTYAAIACTDPDCRKFLGSHYLRCSTKSICQYEFAYGQSGTSTTIGDFSSETITINTTDGTPMPFPAIKFGLGTNQTGEFNTETDGIFGLGRGPLSFLSQIGVYINNRESNNSKFSYCLVNQDEKPNVTSTIVFGAAAALANGSNVTVTRLLTPFNVSEVPFYYVSLLDIAVDGAPIRIPPGALAVNTTSGSGGVIVDSGTTYSVFTESVYTLLRNSFTSAVANASGYPIVDLLSLTGLDLCFDVSGIANVAIPTVTFIFANGTNIELGVGNVAPRFKLGLSDYFCLAFISAGDAAYSVNVIGNAQQTNFQLTFDIDLERISWQKTTC